MRRTTRLLATGATVLAAVSVGGTGTASAAPTAARSGDLLVLSEHGVLSRHDAGLPLLAKQRKRITGLARGERLVGLDTRPATGEVYTLASSGQLYRINPVTAAATAIGAPISLSGKAIGFDFNPTVDRIRVVTDQGQNLRLHPDTGALAATDTPLNYPTGGPAPKVAAAGYTNGVAGATTTALYGLDSARNTLVKQGSLPGETPVVSPNTGQLAAIGKLGLDISAVNGFDIAGRAGAGAYRPQDYRAAAIVRVHGLTLLVRINLATGRAHTVSPLLSSAVGLTFAP
ncbi:DUF4394 domain-containing protein [Crossiella sp. CA-258035]|uniref:DUF4394 domain-containing protein n=1 Tax=Crossiella sp. CA-258035 TaxID=2981138 RepID=UPI0024BD3D57|nr:DUF4394 domain-containing protein [Crossiella sp. CA-258035]WHT16200.1 DUF4394 domain-containing protein [Crossiella sp. CA-258035]